MSKLTQAEFDAVLPLLRMSPERLESARLRLVAPTDLADEFRLRTAQAEAELPARKRTMRATAKTAGSGHGKGNRQAVPAETSASRGAKA
jgi:hypothetical protein